MAKQPTTTKLSKLEQLQALRERWVEHGEAKTRAAMKAERKVKTAKPAKKK